MTKHSRGLAATVAALLAFGLLLAAPAATAHPSAQAQERRATFAPTLEASRPRVISGSAFTLTGTVKPVRKGTEVVLYKRNPGATRWTVEARRTTTARGTFRFVDRPHAVGVRAYRVVVPARGSVRKGYSNTVRITTYAWRSLVKDVGRRAARNTYVSSKVQVNGKVYGPSWEGASNTSDGGVDWNLGRSCLRLRATLGLADRSDDSTSALISLTADGASRYTRSFTVGQSVSTTIDVRGVFRAAFHWDTAGTASRVLPVMAEPEALCAF